MNKGKVRGGMRAAISAALVVVLFQPMVGVLTGTGQGVAYGQAGDPAQERFLSAECVKLRADLDRESLWLGFATDHVDSVRENTKYHYVWALQELVEITNLRDQIAGLDAAEVFLPSGETKVRGLLQEMRKRAEARLTKAKERYEEQRDQLSQWIPDWEAAEADVKKRERIVRDLNAKLRQAGCDLQPGTVISSLPPPSVLGAPLPPARTPTTQVPGSVTRVPPRQPTPGAMRLELVEVTADPKCETWPDECTSNPKGGWITQHHKYDPEDKVFFEARYQWTDPPQQVGPEGFELIMTVSAQSAPRGNLAAGMSVVGGGFELDPGGTSATFQVVSEGGSAQTRTLKVKVKPPKNPNPSGDYYLKIGANYYAGFTYHYRVVR